MSYDEKFKLSKQKVYGHAIATKIRTLMGELRKSSNEDRKKRWVWELLQNAKDVSYDDQQIEVEIESTGGQLEFRHNGKPFTVEDITFLVEQVSTKDQKTEIGKKPKKTGKFGTGFLTTHLLSEKVYVDSVIKDDGEPHKKFSLLLDRSGREISEILDSVNKSLQFLDDLDSKPAMPEFNRAELNTSFKYKLDDKGEKVAKIGKDDLSKIFPFVLAFNGKFKAVKVVSLIDEIIEGNGEPIKLNKNTSIHRIVKGDLFTSEEISIVVLSNGLTSIAAPIEEKDDGIAFKELDKTIPRLFIDFPLVGSEAFSFPVIINNAAFSPTEPRDGIDLTDNDDIDIVNNMAYISEAVSLYYELLEYASSQKWKNLHLLAKLSTPTERDWLSISWFERDVLEAIRGRLTDTLMVELEDGGYVPIINADGHPNVYFPSAANKEVRERIWQLSYGLFPDKMPKKDQIHNWYSVLWPACYRQTCEELTNDLQKKETLEGLSEAFDTQNDALNWLNSYFDLLNFESKFIQQIIENQHAVIPNQNGRFKTPESLRVDKDIEESLKDTLQMLGNDPREDLVHKKIVTTNKYKKEKEGQIVFHIRKQEDIVSEINKLLKEGQEDGREACNFLLSLFADGEFPENRIKLYNISKQLFPDETPGKTTINSWDDTIWTEADKFQLKRIVTEVAQREGISNFSLPYNQDINIVFQWLNNVVSYLVNNDFESQLNLKTAPILPNQNGEFRIKDDLFLDDGLIPDVLKDVVAALGYDFREELLDVRIYLELPVNRTINKQLVADKISALISPKFAETPRTEDTKNAFRKLVIWFNSNKEEAYAIFGDLFNNRFKLYDDEEVAASFQKSEQLSEIMTEFGITNLLDLRSALQAGSNLASTIEQELITQEVLANLGVASIEELEDAFKNKEISARYFHTSKPTSDMFKYAQGLIERAIANVIAHLKSLPGYDCVDLEPLARTVLGGITKNGLDIHVVVRPSDHGEVIFYYDSEKDSLDYENAELWIDNGVDTPSHLTLGKILKTTGINRIPV